MTLSCDASHGRAEAIRTACLVAGVYNNGEMTAPARAIDKATGGGVRRARRAGDLPGEIGNTLWLRDTTGVAAERVLLVGLGDPQKLAPAGFRRAIAGAAQVLALTGARAAVHGLAQTPVPGTTLAQRVRHVVEASDAALYRFTRLKSTDRKRAPGLARLTVLVADRSELAEAARAAREAQAVAAGVELARTLGNLPGNICTPSYLAAEARRLGREQRLRVRVLDEPAMRRLGMGSLLSVSRGSRQPARLIIMEYRGARRPLAPVVLVGKGLTFDAGGISLKQAAAMDEMKFDMCGGAAVFGTLRAVAEMGLPINVIGLVPSSENLPDGNANKPGDIVRSMSGQTIEILNTDAEGRLILCDALTYAERFRPAAVIDIATLTGACVVALGGQASGLMSPDERLAEALLKAGQDTHDRAWRMPVWDEYQSQLDSNFADIANIGGREAGAVTAACFLARFTRKYRWAHLDIAGTAWLGGKEKGATGRPVPLLTRFLVECAARAPRGRARRR